MIIFTLLLSVLLVPADTARIEDQELGEVVVVASSQQGGKRAAKGAVASIDEHLRELNHVDLIRRGAYAWEPMINNMQTERLSTTIDGMKIFPACTDKMDPVTSYVESGNLQSISMNSGLYGNPQSTGNIGGSLDLKLQKAGFDNDPFHLNVNAGHEWNGHLQVYGTDAAYSSHRFYANGGVFYRHADNYKAGGNEIAFSQFRKVNVFSNLGYRLAELHFLEATFIYDRASNVGYPALNMDVKKAEGVITSLSYTRLFDRTVHPFLYSWETKVYYNHITHVMDDSHRPNVEIRMDMPGKSRTGGLYSLLRAVNDHHDISLNYDLYYNRVFADMTMYPNEAMTMYMVTWPDVGTLNTGLALRDNVTLPHHQGISLSGKLSWQNQDLNSKKGYEALKAFFPEMKDNYYQMTGRIAAKYTWSPGPWQLMAGAGWGSRAPTVTEAYGYYLNNTFDRYDYIGNPHLKNESAIELNTAVNYSPISSNGRNRLSIGLDANAFFFYNYIIGHFDVRLSPMTVGAQGVKVYGNQDHAKIVNVNLTTKWLATQWLTLNAKAGYSLGKDEHGENLPLVSPFSYQASLDFLYRRLQGQIVILGNTVHSQYGLVYGEDRTPAYTITNINAQYHFPVGKTQLTVRIGVENLFDRSYTTYADWNGILQKGRNVYVNLTFGI